VPDQLAQSGSSRSRSKSSQHSAAHCVQNDEALHHRSFVVAAFPLLDPHVLSHLAGSPNDRNVCTNSGTPPRAVSFSGNGSGSISNSSGDSVGEGLRAFFTQPFYRPVRTRRV